MILSYDRGHEIYLDPDNIWRYRDNNDVCEFKRPCKRCGRGATEEGYDACLGYIEGVKSACCGHGVIKTFNIKEVLDEYGNDNN